MPLILAIQGLLPPICSITFLELLNPGLEVTMASCSLCRCPLVDGHSWTGRRKLADAVLKYITDSTAAMQAVIVAVVVMMLFIFDPSVSYPVDVCDLERTR